MSECSLYRRQFKNELMILIEQFYFIIALILSINYYCGGIAL